VAFTWHFFVENRNFCSKFIETISPNEFDLFFKKLPITAQKIQKRGSVAKSPKTWQMPRFRGNVTSLHKNQQKHVETRRTKPKK
jgi:hypothetical protein